MPAPCPSAPSFLQIIKRPRFSTGELRQFLASSHRRPGPDQAMPNPRLTEYKIEAIVAYLEALRADRSRRHSRSVLKDRLPVDLSQIGLLGESYLPFAATKKSH